MRSAVVRRYPAWVGTEAPCSEPNKAQLAAANRGSTGDCLTTASVIITAPAGGDCLEQGWPLLRLIKA